MSANISMELPNSGLPVVLAYDRTHPKDLSLAWLSEQGVEVRSGRSQNDPDFRRYSEEEIIAEAQGAVAVLGVSSAHFTRRVLEELPQLQFISKVGVGTDTIDINAATERGILVSNTLESKGAGAVAEHTLALMLALFKQLNVWNSDYIRQGGWRGVDRFSRGIDGATIGIIGFGRIGRAVAERLSGWNAHIIAYDPFVTAGESGVTMVDFPTLLSESDIVTLHCAPTDENFHLIDAKALQSMKQGAILINAGRGTLVDMAALKGVLKSGHLSGAGLDVFEQEPPDRDDELFSLQNVWATPHIAARTLDVYLERRWRAAQNVWAMISGKGHADVVNPEARLTSAYLDAVVRQSNRSNQDV